MIEVETVDAAKLLPHPTNKKLKVTASELIARRGPWYITIPAGTPTNGATIPWPINKWLRPYDEDYKYATLVHDCLVGEFTDRMPITSVGGLQRVLSWKESAVWMREMMRVDYNGDGKRDNSKFIRKLFYHSVMLYKRLGIRRLKNKFTR